MAERYVPGTSTAASRFLARRAARRDRDVLAGLCAARAPVYAADLTPDSPRDAAAALRQFRAAGMAEKVTDRAPALWRPTAAGRAEWSRTELEESCARIMATAKRVAEAAETIMVVPPPALSKPDYSAPAESVTFNGAVAVIQQWIGARVCLHMEGDGHPAGASVNTYGRLSYLEDERLDERSGFRGTPDQVVMLSIEDHSFVYFSRVRWRGGTWRPAWQELVISQQPGLRLVIEFGDE